MEQPTSPKFLKLIQMAKKSKESGTPNIPGTSTPHPDGFISHNPSNN